jgi:hypothetical protein
MEVAAVIEKVAQFRFSAGLITTPTPGRIDEQYNAMMRIPMIDNRMCTTALTAASAIICSPPPAIAARFDGNWSLVAQTTLGHCGSIEIGVAIRGGRIYSTSGSFAGYAVRLGGRISASGHVRMNAVAGPRNANGAGRFGRFQGNGTWAGRGPSGVCSGVWSAGRS